MIQCDDTEFVTLGDRTVVSRSSRYKGIFTGNKLSLLFFSCFACRSTSHRRARGLFRFRFSTLPVRNSFVSYGASAVVRTSDRGHVAEVKKTKVIEVAGSQSGFPKKPFSPLMSTGVQFLAQRC